MKQIPIWTVTLFLVALLLALITYATKSLGHDFYDESVWCLRQEDNCAETDSPFKDDGPQNDFERDHDGEYYEYQDEPDVFGDRDNELAVYPSLILGGFYKRRI